MEISRLAKKLLIKPTQRVLIVNAPVDYIKLLDPLPREVKICTALDRNLDLIQLFVLNRQELQPDLKWLEKLLHPGTILWITYPKKSSGIVSDLEMRQSWAETSKYGLTGVAAVSIDETWTALRFRPTEQVKRSEGCNAAIENNILGQYIDPKNRSVSLPPELRSAMEARPASFNFFQTLSYTNKKEYVTWVLMARQAKTKTDRIQKTVEKLVAAKKNPAEK